MSYHYLNCLQEGSLDNMLWGGKENEQTINFLETCLKRDAAPRPPPESDGLEA